MIPYPDPIAIALVARLDIPEADGRVSTELDSTLPALRVTKVGDFEAPTSWEATPIYRIEVWSDDEAEAGDIAWRIKNTWPTARREVVLDGLVHGRWVETDPRPLPDPETELPRYLVDVGIRLSGAPTP